MTDELFITEKGQSYPLQDFWGYCDGNNIYIRSAKNLFMLCRTGNTFNTIAVKSVSRKYTDFQRNVIGGTVNTITGLPISPFIKNNYTEKPAAFQLDMQNGDIY